MLNVQIIICVFVLFFCTFIFAWYISISMIWFIHMMSATFTFFSLSLKYTLLLHVVTMKVILSYFLIQHLIDSNYIINIILVIINNTLINIVMVSVIKNFVWIEAIIPTGTSTIWCAWNFQLMATTTRWTFQELCNHTEQHLTTLVEKEELFPTKVCYIYIWRGCLPCCFS